MTAREVVHALGKAAALCGAELLLVPMNFAPHSVFGREPKPLPRGGKDRRWCPECVAVRAESVRLDGEK